MKLVSYLQINHNEKQSGNTNKMVLNEIMQYNKDFLICLLNCIEASDRPLSYSSFALKVTYASLQSAQQRPSKFFTLFHSLESCPSPHNAIIYYTIIAEQNSNTFSNFSNFKNVTHIDALILYSVLIYRLGIMALIYIILKST